MLAADPDQFRKHQVENGAWLKGLRPDLSKARGRE
jgi:hypothetical protein